MTMDKIKRELSDIKSLITILQNRVIDIEEIISNYNEKPQEQKVELYIPKSINIEVAETSISQTKEEELKKRGDACAEAGLSYELQVFNIVSHCYEKKTNLIFNTQLTDDIEYLSKDYDLVCQYKIKNNIEEIPIELKKYRTPDWGQCNLQFNTTETRWEVSERSTLSNSLRSKVNNILKDVEIFENKEPIFFQKRITPEEWIEIKKQDSEKWNDVYINIPFNYIDEYYTDKGNYYIQISDGYGLYHFSEGDICGFGVPKFECPQKLRIRVKKVRVRSGFIKLVVAASVSPVNYCEGLVKSPYTLDSRDKLPTKLIYKLN